MKRRSPTPKQGEPSPKKRRIERSSCVDEGLDLPCDEEQEFGVRTWTTDPPEEGTYHPYTGLLSKGGRVAAPTSDYSDGSNKIAAVVLDDDLQRVGTRYDDDSRLVVFTNKLKGQPQQIGFVLNHNPTYIFYERDFDIALYRDVIDAFFKDAEGPAIFGGGKFVEIREYLKGFSHADAMRYLFWYWNDDARAYRCFPGLHPHYIKFSMRCILDDFQSVTWKLLTLCCDPAALIQGAYAFLHGPLAKMRAAQCIVYVLTRKTIPKKEDEPFPTQYHNFLDVDDAYKKVTEGTMLPSTVKWLNEHFTPEKLCARNYKLMKGANPCTGCRFGQPFESYRTATLMQMRKRNKREEEQQGDEK